MSAAVHEPAYFDTVVVLKVRSPEESRYYANENNIVELEGKSLVIAQELE